MSVMSSICDEKCFSNQLSCFLLDPTLTIQPLSEGISSMGFAPVLRRHKKADLADRLKCLILLRNNGRDGVIRTLDP